MQNLKFILNSRFRTWGRFFKSFFCHIMFAGDDFMDYKPEIYVYDSGNVKKFDQFFSCDEDLIKWKKEIEERALSEFYGRRVILDLK